MESHEQFAVVRRAAGISQYKLGHLSGICQNAISQWERGTVSLPPARLKALHAALQKELQNLNFRPEEVLGPALADFCVQG